VSVGRIDVGVAVEEARYERDAAKGVRGEWAVWVWAGRLMWCCATAHVWAFGRGCAVRFLAASSTRYTKAKEASGYLFNLKRDAKTGKWSAQIKLRGVQVNTRLHKHAWQAAAELEWQLARWCAHTGEPRSHYVSNAARLVELGHADAAGVLTAAVMVAPWDLSWWDGGAEATGECRVLRVSRSEPPPPALPPLASAASATATLPKALWDDAEAAGAAREKPPVTADVYTVAKQVHDSLPPRARGHISLLAVSRSIGFVRILRLHSSREWPVRGGGGGGWRLASTCPRPPAQPLTPSRWAECAHPALPTPPTAPCRRPRVRSWRATRRTS
jgi:hypothetical protein